jgi:hypothetical protein
MKLKTYIIFGLLLLTGGLLQGQDISFKVQAPTMVEEGSQFRITYVVNADVDDFQGPEFTDFQLLGGPSVSTSSSFQIINNRTSQSIERSYTYYVRATKAGTFMVPQAQITVNGKTYKSGQWSVKVVKAKGGAYKSASKKAMSEENPADFDPEDRVFVKTLVSKRKVFVGEPIILVQKLYSKERIANITDFKEPAYNGFWKENIDIGDLKLTRENLNGEPYNVVVMQKYILFPQKTGKLQIGSYQIDATVQVIKTRAARDPMEQMMYGNRVRYYANENLTLKSKPLTITVMPLPPGKPAGFKGLVGDFTMEASVDKTELPANDAFNLKIRVKGKGNISLLEIPRPDFPPDFEVYDPKISQKSSTDGSGMSGSKTYEYLIIPRNEGDYIIPAFSFSFFNPRTESYETLHSDTFRIKVGKGSAQSFTTTTGTVVNRDEIKYLGKDIHYIKTNTSELREIGSHSFNSLWHFLYMGISTLLAIIFIIVYKKTEKRRANHGLMRNKRATKVARKHLKKAKKLLGSQDVSGFYEDISKGLWGYLSDKFNIPRSELSMDTVRGHLSSKNVPNELIDEIIEILNSCEFARYAPGGGGNMEATYNQALNIISKIEKSLK